MRYAQFLLWFILFFLFAGYLSAKYDNDFWQWLYYSWDKLKDVLLAVFVMQAVRGKIKIAWKILVIFLVTRVIWEQIVFLWKLNINQSLAIFYLFLVASGAIMLIMFHV